MEIVSCYEKYLRLSTVMKRNRNNVFELVKVKVAKKVEVGRTDISQLREKSYNEIDWLKPYQHT